MSSRMLALFATTLPFAPATAQDAALGPVEEPANEAHNEKPPIGESEPCDRRTDADETTIVVCRRPADSQAYRSPLPAPVESDKRTVPGLHEAPCWVTGSRGVCLRLGSVPEYPPLIDLTRFPEPLSQADRRKVFAVQDERKKERLTGRRVPIDLSED